ncbi:MAG: glycosyltransferase family 4 protein, partial [Deltaproteobacteria bacterium]|nr:glycosyltransferase family 4 protein [Deltaproteobacteria bacterium]
MKLGKVAIVVADQSLSWISCQSISANLRKAYGLAAGDCVTYFGFPEENSRVGTLELARQIFEFRPTTIVFLDHLPHPAPLIHAIDVLWNDLPRPKVVFHVYGDFTIYPFQWMSLDFLLRRYQVAFVTASPRQTVLVRNFLKPGSASVFTAAFPVDSKQFYPSAELRNRTRKLFKVGRRASVIVYTGRLSVQKNSVQMVRLIGDMMQRMSPNAYFFVAGAVDELGVPLFQKKPCAAAYANLLQASLQALTPYARRRTQFVGNLAADDLAELYNAADVFISPSLHHDEDFGMSPAEALMCGVPAVLTDWGGYGQFIQDEADGYNIPVRLG